MKQRGKKGESCRNFATKPNGILVIANSAPTPFQVASGNMGSQDAATELPLDIVAE
jgi:hypothetical protein